ncbi:hypothetical protein MKY82_08375 [Paenibacillus sp. FSL W7-1279]|uniref:hypothetical protein n=1 Tax=Paenibacillus sp. FSL W7-1279 TaxID=2921697 RepID=UPI0030DD1440
MGHYFYITPEEYAIAEKNGISSMLLDWRLRTAGWPKERALSEPPRKMNVRKHWIALAESNGIKRQTFNRRLEYGWDPERAATEPVADKYTRQKLCLYAKSFQGKYSDEIIATAASNGISRENFYARVRRGWTEEEAATTPLISYADNGRRSIQKMNDRYGDINKSVFQKRG